MMDKLISQQAAIEALAKMMPSLITPDGSHPADAEIFKAQEMLVDCIKTIEELPPVQSPVLTCDGCRHVGTYDTDFPCSGCIRREKDYYEQER